MGKSRNTVKSKTDMYRQKPVETKKKIDVAPLQPPHKYALAALRTGESAQVRIFCKSLIYLLFVCFVILPAALLGDEISRSLSSRPALRNFYAVGAFIGSGNDSSLNQCTSYPGVVHSLAPSPGRHPKSNFPVVGAFAVGPCQDFNFKDCRFCPTITNVAKAAKSKEDRPELTRTPNGWGTRT